MRHIAGTEPSSAADTGAGAIEHRASAIEINATPHFVELLILAPHHFNEQFHVESIEDPSRSFVE